MLAIPSRAAFADATLFIGTSGVSSSDNASRQTTKGFSIGAGLLIVGVEFEYAQTAEDGERLGPALRTGVGNVYVQTPVPIVGLQFYATTGGGLYREKSTLTGGDIQKTGFASDTGGGVKISLLGPLKARVDYRVFKLLGDKPQPNWRSTVQRLYAGINLGF
jgi:hypothetical protein